MVQQVLKDAIARENEKKTPTLEKNTREASRHLRDKRNLPEFRFISSVTFRHRSGNLYRYQGTLQGRIATTDLISAD
jgi:hypothetical protein